MLRRRTLVLAACAGLGALPAIAQQQSGKPVSFAAETPGKEPTTFAPMVGSWVISREANQNVLFIDGRVWKRGQPAGGLADKARELYGVAVTEDGVVDDDETAALRAA